MWFILASKDIPHDLESATGPQRSLGARNGDVLMAASLLGFGTGLLTSAIVNLASDRKRRTPNTLAKKNLRLTLSPTSARIHITF